MEEARKFQIMTPYFFFTKPDLKINNVNGKVIFDISDVESQHEIFRTKISAFAAFCLRCSEDDDLNIFNLETPFLLGLSNDAHTNENISILRREVKLWIISACFQSLVELFAMYLDKLFFILSFVKSSILAHSEAKFDKDVKTFFRLGVDKKVAYLTTNYGLDDTSLYQLDGMTKVRNCIIHRQGYVALEDCDNDRNLILRWVGIELQQMNVDGHFVDYPDDYRGAATTRQGDEVRLTIRLIERKFRAGSLIDIKPHDLASLVWGMGHLYVRMSATFKSKFDKLCLELAKEKNIPQLAFALR